MAKVTMVFEDHPDGMGLSVTTDADPEMPGVGVPHSPAQTALLVANYAVHRFAAQLGDDVSVTTVDLSDLASLPEADGEPG